MRPLTCGNPLLVCDRRHLRRIRSRSIIWCQNHGPRRRTWSGIDSFQAPPPDAPSPAPPRPPTPTSMTPFARRPVSASTAPIPVGLAPHPRTIPAPFSLSLRPPPLCVCVSVPLPGHQYLRSNAPVLLSSRPRRPRLHGRVLTPTAARPRPRAQRGYYGCSIREMTRIRIVTNAFVRARVCHRVARWNGSLGSLQWLCKRSTPSGKRKEVASCGDGASSDSRRICASRMSAALSCH